MKVVWKSSTMVNGELYAMMTLIYEMHKSSAGCWAFLEPSLSKLTEDLVLEIPAKTFCLMTYGAVDMRHPLHLVHSEGGDHIIATMLKMLVSFAWRIFQVNYSANNNLKSKRKPCNIS